MTKILIAEDDAALNNGIALALKQESYQIYSTYSFKDTRDYLSKQTPDLILLDINFPDGNGLSLCVEIRLTSKTPVIFLTANDLETDIITGFSLGADDYITKPFSLMVLRARVSAVLNRTATPALSAGKRTDVYETENFSFSFDLMEFKAFGNPVELSKTEQKLLKILIENKGHTVTRETLLKRIWNDGAYYVDENALTVTISRLRSKLEEKPSQPKYIKTVYSMGYSWSDSEGGR